MHHLEQGRIIKRQNCARGLAPATVRGIHTILHHALKTSTEEGLLPSNPADKAAPPKLSGKPKGILNNQQLDTLMATIEKDELWHDFSYTGLTTGLRRGELCGLKWEDFDGEAGTLKICRTIHSGKGGTLEAGDTKKERSPLDPTAVRKKLAIVLERAGCKHVRFHDLRHTFSTNTLEHGMDIKTLSAVIGHVSSATTLNVYAHVTDEMRQSAAAKIDRAIAKVEPQLEPAIPKKSARTTFRAAKGKYRKPGTGCVTQISDRLWAGRYSPKVNEKRIARNIYARTEAECEEKLAQLIVQMKEEIADLRVQEKA